MRILLTGGSGFVGSHVARELLRRGHDVALLLRPRTGVRRIRDVLMRCEIVVGDLRNPAMIRQPIASYGPEAVVHAAWSGVAQAEREAPAQTENIVAMLELVRLAHDAGARHFVGIGSQAEYGPCSRRIDENHPTNPVTSYGQAKLAAFRAASQLCGELSLRFAWLRLFSTYGPGEGPTWLLPYVAGKLLRGERPSVTAGEQRWDYLYVEDAASAVATVVERTESAGVFNLGSGRTATIRRIIEQVRDLIDPRLPVGFGEIPYRDDQVMHLEADVSRLHALGWRARTPLSTGLARCVDWQREQIAGQLAA